MKRYLLLLVIMLSGCAAPQQIPDLQMAEEQPAPAPPRYANGSLWQETSQGITDDYKARRRGDTLTIVISEQASASKQATTATSRSSSASAGIPNLLGLEASRTIKDFADLSKLVSAENETTFDGSGSTTRKENLTATITARVVDVLPNGNLLIQGQRNVKVNNEDQIIMLQGKVRPRDISADNVVNSIYVADARITYTGKGIISDRQQAGWLLNIIDRVWPF